MNGDPLLINKIVGSVILAGLIAMTAGFIATLTYHPKMLDKPAYAIGGDAPVATATATAAPAAPATATAAPAGPEAIAGLLASADAAAGEKLFKKCAPCHSHKKGGKNKLGPNLWNIVGGPRGTRGGFKYSGTLKKMGGNWSIADLNVFLYKPKMLVKKTKMKFAGFKKAADRANVIKFLHGKADSPIPLPK